MVNVPDTHSPLPAAAVALYVKGADLDPSASLDGSTVGSPDHSEPAKPSNPDATGYSDTAAAPPAQKQQCNQSPKQRRWTAICSFARNVQAKLIANYLPIAFAVGLTIALAYPAPGKAVIHVTILGNIHLIQEIAIALVFIVSGLTLKTDDARNALKLWRGVLFGICCILLITPCLGFIFRLVPFKVKAFNVGLMIFSLVPTTLGIGVALVRACKGTEGLALILTVSTNMLGVFTMPLWVKFLFLNFDTTGLDMNIDIGNLLVRLFITITIPAVLGKAVRELWPAAMRFATNYKVSLGIFSTTCLAFIVWQTLSAAREVLFNSPAVDIIAVVLLAIGQHLFYLAFTTLVVKYFIKMPLEDSIALAIISAQKSAPVAVTVISYITGSPAVQGLLSIPAICGQLCMIVVGSLLSPWLAAKVTAKKAARKLAAEADSAAAAEAAAVTIILDVLPAGKEM